MHWLSAQTGRAPTHVPQLLTVRIAPQLSAAVLLPHCAPRRMQKTASDSGAQTQALAALHICPAPQLPHCSVRMTPQLSAAVLLPQVAPARAQNAAVVSGWHTQALPIQVKPAAQSPLLAPQRTELPQVLLTAPHCALAGQTGVGHTHTLVALHISPAEQPLPHDWLGRLHALMTTPHSALPGHIGSGHTHWLAAVHVSPAPQPPHCSVRMTPQLSAAVLLPHREPLRAQNEAVVSGWQIEQVLSARHAPCSQRPQSTS
jgi:hypothetical protein